MLWVEKGKISFPTSPPLPHILFLSHKVSVLLLWGKFMFDLHCLSLVLREAELIWVQLRIHRWTRWTHWPICRACFYSTPGIHSTPLSDLVSHVFFAKGLGRKKKKSHFEPLIMMTCLELSRHSTKWFISKFARHENFSWVHKILRNQQANVQTSSWIFCFPGGSEV